jgi:hypothetical protein
MTSVTQESVTMFDTVSETYTAFDYPVNSTIVDNAKFMFSHTYKRIVATDKSIIVINDEKCIEMSETGEFLSEFEGASMQENNKGNSVFFKQYELCLLPSLSWASLEDRLKHSTIDRTLKFTVLST